MSSESSGLVKAGEQSGLPSRGSGEAYVTIFDFGFIPQGLALHDSLLEHAGDFTLWVVAMDEPTTVFLNSLGLPSLRVLSLDEVETADLVEVKSTRSRREYCWTLTPFVFDFVFERAPEVGRVTYVDADVFLRTDPGFFFRSLEASGKSVQITEHAFSADIDSSAEHGKFCVQFLTMNRDGSEAVRSDWQGKCLEWCFGRVEEGKFGDQKYLDEWPRDFSESVHIFGDRGRFLGPWNASRFPFSESAVYHFHQLRLDFQGTEVSFGNYTLPSPLVKNVYSPYIALLREKAKMMVSLGVEPSSQISVKTKRQKLASGISPVTDPIYARLRALTARH